MRTTSYLEDDILKLVFSNNKIQRVDLQDLDLAVNGETPFQIEPLR